MLKDKECSRTKSTQVQKSAQVLRPENVHMISYYLSAKIFELITLKRSTIENIILRVILDGVNCFIHKITAHIMAKDVNIQLHHITARIILDEVDIPSR